MVAIFLSAHNPRMQTIVSLVSAEMGFALVPVSIRNLRRPGVCYLEIDDIDCPIIETGIAWSAHTMSPALASCPDVVIEVSALNDYSDGVSEQDARYGPRPLS